MWPRRQDYEVIRLEAKKKVSQWNVEAHNLLADEKAATSYNYYPLLLKSLAEHNFAVRISNRISSPTQMTLERRSSCSA